MPLYQPQPNVFQTPKPPLAPTASPTPPVPSPPPGGINVAASGTAIGSSPLGNMRIPDFSSASPEQIQQIQEGLSGLTYSVPLGGYLERETANDPTSAYVRGYYGHPMTGGQGSANLAAKRLYAMIGDFPTTSGRTGALNALYQREGIAPPQHESLNEITRATGYPGDYGGPFTTPLYNPAETLARRRGFRI